MTEKSATPPPMHTAAPRWFVLMSSLAPQVLQFTPYAVLAHPIIEAIQDAERTGKVGDAKLTAVIESAMTAADAINQHEGYPVIDILTLEAGLIQLVDGIVALVNIVHMLSIPPAEPTHAGGHV